jgi:solute carrier family 35 protein E1
MSYTLLGIRVIQILRPNSNVGNTIKRVVIIVASVVAFKTRMSTGSIIGSSIAIFGTLLYSLAMNATKK